MKVENLKVVKLEKKDTEKENEMQTVYKAVLEKDGMKVVVTSDEVLRLQLGEEYTMELKTPQTKLVMPDKEEDTNRSNE